MSYPVTTPQGIGYISREVARMSPSNYHEEAWEDDRIKRADWYENVPNPQASNMFVRYLLTILSEQRVAINREQWRAWHADHNCALAHR